MDRPTAHDPERFLVTLLLRYPHQAVDQLASIDPDDVLDTRHRLIIDGIARFPGDIEQILASLDEDIASYARDLIAETEQRATKFPLESSREIPIAVRRLAQTRYDTRWRQLQSELQAAKQAGDTAAVSEYIGRINRLLERKQLFDPTESSYFRDIRSTVS